MPKTKKNTYAKPRLKKQLTCSGCAETKKDTDFYSSYNPLHATGRLPFCKDCIQKMCLDINGNISVEKLKETLSLIDRPFIRGLWEISIQENSENPVGTYFKNLGLSQNRKLTWKDSIFNYEEQSKNNQEKVKQEDKIIDFENIIDDFAVTKEMVIKWGNGFQPEQYMMLEDLYQNLFNSYDIDNRSQEEYLKTACLYQLRNIEAIRKGNAQEATKWGGLFDSYMASGKLKPSQLSESDKMGGVTNFATFFQYIEKSNDFIPTFPDLILDDIDYSIFMLLNYNRTLMGLPEISLGEVKNFMTYDYQKGQEIIFPPLSIQDEDDVVKEIGDDDGSV